MFYPLRWLLMLGGLLPKSVKNNHYIAYTVMTLELSYFCVMIYQMEKEENARLVFDIITSVLETGAELIVVAKVHVSRQSYMDFLNKFVLAEQTTATTIARRYEIVTFLSFLTFYLARTISRSLSEGQLVILHDVVMGLQYFPIMMFYVIVCHINIRFSILNNQLREFTETVRTRTLPLSEIMDELN